MNLWQSFLIPPPQCCTHRRAQANDSKIRTHDQRALSRLVQRIVSVEWVKSRVYTRKHQDRLQHIGQLIAITERRDGVIQVGAQPARRFD